MKMCSHISLYKSLGTIGLNVIVFGTKKLCCGCNAKRLGVGNDSWCLPTNMWDRWKIFALAIYAFLNFFCASITCCCFWFECVIVCSSKNVVWQWKSLTSCYYRNACTWRSITYLIWLSPSCLSNFLIGCCSVQTRST